MTHQPPEPKEQQEKWPPRVIIPRAEVFAEGGYGNYFAVWDPKEPFLTSPTEDFEYLSLEEHSALLKAAKAKARREVMSEAFHALDATIQRGKTYASWIVDFYDRCKEADAKAPEAGKEGMK